MRRALFAVGALTGLALGCDSKQDPYHNKPKGSAAPGYETRRGDSYNRGSMRERQASFLKRIRDFDPQFATIRRAELNDNNELGLVLNHSVQWESVPALMRRILSEMAKDFPGQNLTVIAYAPGPPPAQVGIARLDAKTRRMSYTPAQP